MRNTRTAISLFTGAGGMDVGFADAGFKIQCANDIDADACETYRLNHPKAMMLQGCIEDYIERIRGFKGVDLVFGGPPCQGFSVAGKMDPDDPRSSLLWSYLDVVNAVSPRMFVCENVKALGTLEKWRDVRLEFQKRANKMGYDCEYVILNATKHGVPQARERIFFIGAKHGTLPPLLPYFETIETPGSTIRDTISHLGRAGTATNSRVCNARITLAANPVMRKSPYAGMLFNGLGRPVRLNGYSSTLPASMGGNKTPIIDEEELYGGKQSWVEQYHKQLQNGKKPVFKLAPKRLRRMTIDEAILIQTFPEDYVFAGRSSSIYRQIGNAVPCRLAKAVASVALSIMKGKKPRNNIQRSQITFNFTPQYWK